MVTRSVAVELKALVSGYVAGMKQASSATKETAESTLALSKAERDFKASLDQATAAVKANGQTLDQGTAKGRANRAALDQIATTSRQYQATLRAQGASQEQINAVTEQGRTAWLNAASAMGMGEAEAKKLSGTLFSAKKVLRDHTQELNSLALTLGVAGAALLALPAKAVASYAAFDKEMSGVAATGDDAKASLDALRASAIEAGADTMYSASEAAAGIKELLKAGLSAEDVLGGGLAGSLALAASGSMDVASAAEVTSTALAQFKLNGSQASHVADLLAAGANAARGEVSDLGMALSQGGLVAAQTGLTVEETTAALSAFAKAGMLGSDAGTSLKTMLQRLTPQSAEAQAQFDKLGISAYDAQGNFVGLTNFAGQLHQQMKDLTPEARNAALAVMFGSDAVRGAAVLYEQGAAGMQGWIDTVNQQGYATRQAAELTNNLSGDLERLGGSLDTAFIQSGSGANNVLRNMAQGAESLVNWIGQIPEPLLSIATMLTGSGGLAVLGVAGIAKLGSTVMEARNSFRLLGISANTAKLAVSGAGAAVAVGTLAISAWASAQADAKAQTDEFASSMVVVGDKVVWTNSTLSKITDTLANQAYGFMGWSDTYTQAADKMGLSSQDLIGFLQGDEDAINRVRAAQEKANEVVHAEGGLFGNWLSDSNNLESALIRMKGNLTAAEVAALDQADANKAAGTSATTYADALAKSAASTDDATNSLKDYAKQLFESSNAALKASGTEIGWEAALDDTAKAIKKTGEAHRLANGQLDLNTAKGRQNQQALNQLAQSSVAYAQTLIEQGASEKRVQAEMSRSRESFTKQATAAGMSKTAAKELADAYGLIPSDVKTNIAVTGGDKSQTKLAMVQAAIADLPPEKQVEVLSEFDNGGIKAADVALNKINGKHVTAYVDVQAKYVDTYNRARTGGPKLADGGLFEQFFGLLTRRFASGGFGQPQVRPFQGAAGVNWGEQGSGPWEAFISGAPQKRDRSIAIWKDVGRRLLGNFPAEDVISGFADGGITEPTWNGQTLSFWQDHLKSDLELTRLKIDIRDLKKSLAEKETYKDHGHKKRRLKLRGLDRTEAKQQLVEDQDELNLALEARKLNESQAGTIDAQIAAYEAQAQAAQAAQDAADAASQASKELVSKYMTGSSYLDLLANMNAGATSMNDFQNGLARLQNQGLNQTVLDYLASTGSSSLIDDILRQGKAGIDALNGVSGNLTTAANSLGAAESSGNYTPTVRTNHDMPSYVTSQSAGSNSTITNTVNNQWNIQNPDPYAAAVIISQQLRYL